MSNINSTVSSLVNEIIANNEVELSKHNTREAIPTMQEALMAEEKSEIETNNTNNAEKKVDINKMTKQQLKDYIITLQAELVSQDMKISTLTEENVAMSMELNETKEQLRITTDTSKAMAERLMALDKTDREQAEQRVVAKAEMIKVLKLRPVSPLWPNVIVTTNEDLSIFRVSFPIDFYQSNGDCRVFLGNLAKHAKGMGHTATHQPDHLQIALKKVMTDEEKQALIAEFIKKLG